MLLVLPASLVHLTVFATSTLLRRVFPLLRDAAAATHQHAGARSSQRPESRRDGLHARNGQPALRQHHAGAEVHAPAHAPRLPQHQHGPEHQYHPGSTGGPILYHGQEVSAKKFTRDLFWFQGMVFYGWQQNPCYRMREMCGVAK